ncbi:MAG: hypothetical protein ACP5U1_07190 [Desulfomonilaceae bacterium]
MGNNKYSFVGLSREIYIWAITIHLTDASGQAVGVFGIIRNKVELGELDHWAQLPIDKLVSLIFTAALIH